MKEKIKDFYSALNFFKNSQKEYKQVNEQYFKQVFEGQEERIIQKVNLIISPYYQRPPEIFSQIIHSIIKNNFAINKEEIEFITTKPNSSTIKEIFEKKYNISLEAKEFDPIEIKLFKAIGEKDQKSFEKITNLTEFDPFMKEFVLGAGALIAAECRDIEVIRFLIKNKVNINNIKFISSGLKEIPASALEVAIDTGFCNIEYFDEELVNLLLLNGADVNFKRDDRPIYCNIIKNCTEEGAIKLLSGLNYNGEPWGGEILDDVLTKKMYNLVKALVEKGIEINFDTYHYYDNPLFQVIADNNLEMVEYFIDKGAKVNYIQDPSPNEEDYCSKVNYWSYIITNKKIEILELFIRKGADLNLISLKWDLPLAIAVQRGDFNICKLLIEGGADVNACYECDRGCQNIWDFINNDAIARLVISTGKLKLRANERQDSLSYYQTIKAQVDFEVFKVKCEKDIKWLDSEGTGKWSNLVEMLKFYLKTSPGKFKEYVKSDNESFFKQHTDKVILALKNHMTKFWPESMNLYRLKDVSYVYKEENKNSIEIFPKPIIQIIGSELFKYEFLTITGEVNEYQSNESQCDNVI